MSDSGILTEIFTVCPTAKQGYQDVPPQAVTKNAVGIITNDASKSPAVLLLKNFLFFFFSLYLYFAKLKKLWHYIKLFFLNSKNSQFGSFVANVVYGDNQSD